MALRSDWSADPCPIARAADLFGDPWMIVILREITLGNRRFDGLRDTLGIAENVLSTRLARAVDRGLLTREPYASPGRARLEYRLTRAGQDALPVLHALALWAEAHTQNPTGRRMRVFCTGCGAEASSADRCDACHRPLTVATTAWERPLAPGARVALDA